jgi:hypothetical protein
MNPIIDNQVFAEVIQLRKTDVSQKKTIAKLEEKLQELKRKRKSPLTSTPSTPEYNIPDFVNMIINLSKQIRESFPYSGKEHHFQAALEMELRERGYTVSQETTCLLHYKTTNNNIRQLPHDIRGREDLLLPDIGFIIELKQIKALSEDDHRQLLRYMNERKVYNPTRRSGGVAWGNETKGLLINYGDVDVEIWYMFYKNNRPQRIKVHQSPILPLEFYSDAWATNDQRPTTQPTQDNIDN